MLKKLPTTDTAVSLKKIFGDDYRSMLELRTMVISSEIFDQVEHSTIEDVKRKEWAELSV